MNCDRCKSVIDECDGYTTKHEIISITVSRRDGNGRLFNKPVRNETLKSVWCMDCVKSIARARRSEVKA